MEVTQLNITGILRRSRENFGGEVVRSATGFGKSRTRSELLFSSRAQVKRSQKSPYLSVKCLRFSADSHGAGSAVRQAQRWGGMQHARTRRVEEVHS